MNTVRRMIETYQIPSGKLAIEIDEYALAMDPVILEIVMQQLKELGVELILNNFGSGYSGISKILELPVDTLKFERMFIAEGVETQRQLDILKKFGCVYQQGFYYAPTIPEELLTEVLGKSTDATKSLIDQEREKLKR